MFELFLAAVLNGQITKAYAIDNVKFKSISQCESYKAQMHYVDSQVLKFTCERAT